MIDVEVRGACPAMDEASSLLCVILLEKKCCGLNGIRNQGIYEQSIGPNSFKSSASWRGCRGDGGVNGQSTGKFGVVDMQRGSKGSSVVRYRAKTSPEVTRNSTSEGIVQWVFDAPSDVPYKAGHPSSLKVNHLIRGLESDLRGA